MRHSYASFRSSWLPERDMMFTKGLQTGGETETSEIIPDGLAGGFVFDSGGEGGVGLILKQEGQRCLCCI